MKRFLISIAMFFCGINALLASDLTIERSYTLYMQEDKDKDKECIDAFEAQIAPEFRGLNKIQLVSLNVSDPLLTYTEVSFYGIHGDAEGVINCVMDKSSKQLADIAVNFHGSGLGGFEKRGRISTSDDPADWKVTSYTVELTP